MQTEFRMGVRQVRTVVGPAARAPMALGVLAQLIVRAECVRTVAARRPRAKMGFKMVAKRVWTVVARVVGVRPARMRRCVSKAAIHCFRLFWLFRLSKKLLLAS